MFAKLSVFFIFFLKKGCKNGKETEFQKTLARFWKQGIDEQLCHVWTFSSYPFLRSILEKERRNQKVIFVKNADLALSCSHGWDVTKTGSYLNWFSSQFYMRSRRIYVTAKEVDAVDATDSVSD